MSLPRVTEIVNHLFPEHPDGWLEKLGYTGKKTEQEVLEWSQDFGTTMHAWCLEGKMPEKRTRLMEKCMKQFEKFLVKECPKTIYTEKKVIGKDEFKNPIYMGTSDWGARIKGRVGLIELKFFSCWRWWLKFKIPTCPEISAGKAAKTNLQTKLYEEGQDDFFPDFRAVLWITPDFYVYKEFPREPKKLEAAIEYAKSLVNKALNF